MIVERLVDNLRRIYPSSNIWLVGHSLGGALASLLGATYGLPAVAFESPGERLAAQRLHLPLPPFALHPGIPAVAVTHVYHNADPIPAGTCTGFGSPCAQLGYALETKCHLGKSIVFDTVGKLGWRVDVRLHSIKNVIHKVLEIEDVEWEDGRDVPMARAEADCVVSLLCPESLIRALINAAGVPQVGIWKFQEQEQWKRRFCINVVQWSCLYSCL